MSKTILRDEWLKLRPEFTSALEFAAEKEAEFMETLVNLMKNDLGHNRRPPDQAARYFQAAASGGCILTLMILGKRGPWVKANPTTALISHLALLEFDRLMAAGTGGSLATFGEAKVTSRIQLCFLLQEYFTNAVWEVWRRVDERAVAG